MRKIVSKVLILGVVCLMGFGWCHLENVTAVDTEASDSATADAEAADAAAVGTSISLSPTSKILQIASSSVYDNSFYVSNDGSADIKIEVYAAPYSYVYSDEEDLYKLGFNNENNFTQISRWITFKDTSGSYTKKAFFTIKPGERLEINYRISTPANIPEGGQYAVIFAHTLSDATNTSGIRTEASPGLVVYGRSTEGEVNTSVEISSLEIKKSVTTNAAGDEHVVRNNFYASAKIKNTGNVDFSAVGVLKVEPIIGGGTYETPNNKGKISVIPEAELILSDEWEETPSSGIYKVTWTVMAGDKTETIERVIFLIPAWIIILSIIFLTILFIWIIIKLRKRKERRSRLAV